MTISTESPIIRYAYAGPGRYDFPYSLRNASHLVVKVISIVGDTTVLANLDDYTVVINPLPAIGGYITTVSPAAAGGTIELSRELPITQPRPWSAEGFLNLDLIEQAFDELVMQLQQFYVAMQDTTVPSNWLGDWATGILYKLRRIVRAPDGNWYSCIIEHTSGTFATDLTAGRWLLVIDMDSIIDGLYASGVNATVNTLADLRAFSAGSAIVVVLGRTTVGDGGGGVFYWSWADSTTLITNDPESGVYVAPTAWPTGFGGCWVRQYDGPLHLRWFGDDGDAMQAAVNFAAYKISLDNTARTMEGVGVEILVSGSVDFGATTVDIPYTGIGITGEVGKGSEIRGNGTLFNVGDYTDTSSTIRVRYTSFKYLNFVANVLNNTASALVLYRTSSTDISHCQFINWNIGIDCFRASTTTLSYMRFTNTNRTAQATAFIRMQGTDESDTVLGETYTPGGGMHITDIEGLGAAGGGSTYDTTSAILLHSVDGFYMQQSHFTGYVYGLHVDPQATPENYIIFDVMVSSNCYFDQPSKRSGVYPRNIYITGTVKERITLANSDVVKSKYNGIRISDSYLRGSSAALYNVHVSVTDGDDFWDSGEKIDDISISNNRIRQSKAQQILFTSASPSGTGGVVEVYGASIEGNHLSLGNSSGATGVGSAIHVACERVIIAGNHIGVPDTTVRNPDYGIYVAATDAGDDYATPSAIVVNNDTTRGTYTLEAIRIVRSATSRGAATIQDLNMYKGPGKIHRQLYKFTSAIGDTLETAWTHGLVANTSGSVNIYVTGQNSTNEGSGGTASKSAAFHFYCGFRHNGTAAALSTGASSMLTVRSWNPDSLPLIPTAELSGTSLRVQTAGIDGEIWNWAIMVEMLMTL